MFVPLLTHRNLSCIQSPTQNMNILLNFCCGKVHRLRGQLRALPSGRYLSTNPFPRNTSGLEEVTAKMTIDNMSIRYRVVGNGNKTVLCLPGIIGSIETDFGPILEPLIKTKEFTVVCWDPPGYGNSRPPDRNFEGDFYRRDAQIVAKLMERLGCNDFSVLGWSNGGVSGGWLAGEYCPTKVTKLVTWGSHAFADDRAVMFSKLMENLENWSDKMKAPMMRLYGEKYLQKMLTDWGKSVENYQKDKLDLDFKEALARITCPALIIHGELDQVLGIEHAEFIHQQIKNSTLKVFLDGKHNLHLRFTDEFLQLVVPFLLKK